MFYSKAKGVTLACCALAVLLAAPAESNACRCLDGLFGLSPTGQTTYRPLFGAADYAPAPAACTSCVGQTCQYVPQTSYRTVYRPVAVTTYRPVTGWTYRPQLVPYTTYRVIYSNPCVPCASCSPCNPCSSCGPCAGGACATTIYSGATLPGVSSCPTCVPSAGPATTYSNMAPSADTSADPAPSATGAGGTAFPEPQTFQEDNQPQPQKTLKPIPKVDTKLNSTPVPNLIGPNNRTTLRPIRPASHFRMIASPRPAAASGGWRASRD